jgi:hypothetical protein
MITAVRQLTLSITTLGLIYAILLIVLHKTLRSPITKKSLFIRHILIPITLYTTAFYTAQYYTTSEQLKKLLPIDSGLVRSGLADLLSRAVGLSICLLSIVALSVIAIDLLMFLYAKKRIPALITYIITLSLSSIAYYTVYITLSGTKTGVANHANLMLTAFLWLEGSLGVIILMICTLIIASYIQSRMKKI